MLPSNRHLPPHYGNLKAGGPHLHCLNKSVIFIRAATSRLAQPFAFPYPVCFACIHLKPMHMEKDFKRIITCSDGTWNQPVEEGSKATKAKTSDSAPCRPAGPCTNVELIFNYICDSDPDGHQQVKAYDAGVGTGYSLKDRFAGGITGAGIDQNIKDMYTFIVLNYVPGDHIYLFGFSRGAYTARSLAGLIRNCGILRPEHLPLVTSAYELYRNRNKYTAPDSDMMVSFRKNYCFEDTSIHFIGVWDTVGALGIPHPFFGKRYRFHDTKLSRSIRYAYHALALDEKRSLFAPTLWERDTKDSKDTDIINRKDTDIIQEMEQRWFAGVHSDIGGGYPDSGLSDISLRWMLDKAQKTGLCFHPNLYQETVGNITGQLNDSFTIGYQLLSPFYPAKRRTVNDGDSITSQTIDESVWERMRKDPNYRPKNIEQYIKSKEGVLAT